MSSPSSRSRIDQFFTSRKKRPSSAKDTTPDKASRSTPEVSPSAKGTLDGFLVKPAAAAGPVKRNLTAEIGLAPTARKPDSHLVNNAVSADPVGIEVREPPSGPSGGNTELRRFASDFLSLYCSDLPSAEIIPAEQELKGQKRNVSPSLVVAHSKACVKKQCIVEQSDSMMGAESTSCSKDCSEPMEPDTIQPMELVESKACMGLRRCTVTPTSGLLKSGIGVPRCGIGTPKSSSRNSLFSPGEEFWNEAIQVADGLFDVVDKLPEGLPFLKSGQASNKLLNDKISYHCLDQKTKAIDKTLSAVESNKESLLPVKHFDFSHEECNGNTEISSLQRIMEKSEAVRNTGIGLADSSSVNKKCMQTSNVLVRCQAQSSSQNLSKKMDSSINEPVDMKVDSISDKQLNKNLPSLLDEKSSQTVELLSGLAVTDTNACVVTKRDVLTHIQKDKDLSVPSHNPV